MVNPDGKLVQQEIYDYVTTRPRLSEDSDGNIFVRGGVLRAELLDNPASEPPDQLARLDRWLNPARQFGTTTFDLIGIAAAGF